MLLGFVVVVFFWGGGGVLGFCFVLFGVLFLFVFVGVLFYWFAGFGLGLGFVGEGGVPAGTACHKLSVLGC